MVLEQLVSLAQIADIAGNLSSTILDLLLLFLAGYLFYYGKILPPLAKFSDFLINLLGFIISQIFALTLFIIQGIMAIVWIVPKKIIDLKE